jgi:hypothetical protein
MKKSPDLPFTPEQEVLLWSIRVDHSKDQRIAEILEKGVDWIYIEKTAMHHGIIPLLYRRLTKEMTPFVPSNKMIWMKRLSIENAANNLHMTQQLIRLLDLFDEARIEAMPFKGPALAVQAYEDFSMRSYIDLDILIHENDFSRAYDILTNVGCFPQYILNTPVHKKVALMRKDFKFSIQDFTFELHWNFTERFWSVPLEMEPFWDRSVIVSIEGRQLRTLSVEDTFFILCIHGAKHSFQKLKWLMDVISLLSHHSEIKLGELISRAEQLGLKRIILLNLYLARDYSGILFHPEINIQLDSDPEVQALARKIPEYLFHSQNGIFQIPPSFFYLKYRERLTDKLRFLVYYLTDVFLLPTREDFQVVILPDMLFPVYFFIRLIRGTLECGSEIIYSFLPLHDKI